MNKNNYKTILFSLMSSFIILAICSKSSFLYAINNWGDANCYYTIGRGMLHGLVPFKDYAEQKGPVIFILYALGLSISEHSFIGIYIIESVCASIFLLLSHKILDLFCDMKGYEIIISFGLPAAVYSAYSMRHGGGPEELSICLITYAIYLATFYLEKGLLPSMKQMFMLGICAGLIFWTKYTLCATYIALLLFMLINSLYRKEYTLFFQRIFIFILGCITISLPILIYFAANNALYDLFKWYFYKNIFLYKSDTINNSNISTNLIFALQILLKPRNAIADILLLTGALSLLSSKKYKIFTMYTATFLFSFVIFNIGVSHLYSSLPLYSFCLFGFYPIISFLRKYNFKINLIKGLIYSISCILIAYVFCVHTYDMLKEKSSYPQYVFAEEMNTYGDATYDLLYYGVLDQAFYFASGKLPKWKAFNQTNLGGNELLDLQNEYVNMQEPEFIVTTDKILCDSTEYKDTITMYNELYKLNDKNIVAFDNFGYDLLDEMIYFFQEENHVARLYIKRSMNE